MMRLASSIERDVSTMMGARPTARRLGASHIIVGGVDARFYILAMGQEVDKITHSVPNDTALHQVSILGKIQCIHPLALCHDLCTKLLCSTPSSCMGDKEFVCQGSHEAVSLFSQCSSWPPMVWGEQRHHQETALS
jgi:hypothetical protein